VLEIELAFKSLEDVKLPLPGLVPLAPNTPELGKLPVEARLLLGTALVGDEPLALLEVPNPKPPTGRSARGVLA